jgi:hypothetical protein
MQTPAKAGVLRTTRPTELARSRTCSTQNRDAKRTVCFEASPKWDSAPRAIPSGKLLLARSRTCSAQNRDAKRTVCFEASPKWDSAPRAIPSDGLLLARSRQCGTQNRDAKRTVCIEASPKKDSAPRAIPLTVSCSLEAGRSGPIALKPPPKGKVRLAQSPPMVSSLLRISFGRPRIAIISTLRTFAALIKKSLSHGP